ncbi:MAG: hypothetical protein ACRCX2_08535 [Paraclostridium sp.]
MSSYKKIIVDEETGELIHEESINVRDTSQISNKLHKKMVDEMLHEASNTGKLDANMLYQWCKITGNINSYGQIKLIDAYRNPKFEKQLVNDIILTGYTMRIITIAHPFSGFLKSNHKKFIETWTELYEEIGIGNSKATQSRVKKFLVTNNIVREFKIGGTDGKLVKRLILNPFLARNGCYTAQVSAMVYQDFIKEGVNMNCYPVRWLQAMGYTKETK